MSLFRILLAVIVITIVLGFGYLAIVEVPVEQSDIQKTIPKELYLNEKE